MDLLCTAVSLHDGYLIHPFTTNQGDGARCNPMLVRRAKYEECNRKITECCFAQYLCIEHNAQVTVCVVACALSCLYTVCVVACALCCLYTVCVMACALCCLYTVCVVACALCCLYTVCVVACALCCLYTRILQTARNE